MKKILATMLLAASSTLTYANEYNLDVKCVSFDVLDVLTAEYKELPFIRGASIREGARGMRSIPFVMFLNAKTGSWTFTERITENEFCILASGDKFEPVPADIIDKTIKRRQGY
jgi:hypothetical protein